GADRVCRWPRPRRCRGRRGWGWPDGRAAPAHRRMPCRSATISRARPTSLPLERRRACSSLLDLGRGADSLVPRNRVEIGACVEHLGAALAGYGRGKTSLPKQSGRYATPIRLISHSSSTPELSLTRRRTVSPSVSMSAAVALPRLIRKLQCISDTC